MHQREGVRPGPLAGVPAAALQRHGRPSRATGAGGCHRHPGVGISCPPSSARWSAGLKAGGSRFDPGGGHAGVGSAEESVRRWPGRQASPPGPPSPATYPRSHFSTWSCGAVGKAHLVLAQEIVGSSPTRTTHRGGTADRNARGQGQHRAPPGSGNQRARDPAGRRWPLARADADVAQQVERQASTLDVAGSIPVVRLRCRGTGWPDAACRRPRCAARPSRRPGSCSPGEGRSSRPWDLGTPSTFRVALSAARPDFGSGGHRFEPCTRSEGRVRMARSAGGSSARHGEDGSTGSAATRPYPGRGRRVRHSRADPVNDRPGSPIGRRRRPQKAHSAGSSPARGTPP